MADEQLLLSRCHPWFRPRVVAVLTNVRAFLSSRNAGETIRLVESTRTLEQQQHYYAKGASKADGVHTFSFHQYDPALAVDCLIVRGNKVVPDASDPAWQKYGAEAEAQGLEWGGRWKGLVDGPHIQVPHDQQIRLLQEQLHVTADGSFGPGSKAALAEFEKKGGFAPHNGSFPVAPPTWAALCRGML